MLAADGIFYFILALVDLLSHVIPAARSSATTSKAIDLFLGSVSFVPILFYTSYLLWLSRMEFITYLPLRQQPPARYLLTGLIPVVVLINVVASVGVSIQNLSVSQDSPVIDFTSKGESLWLSLGQLSLGLYTTYQCLLSFLAFYRLFTAFIDQRRIDTKHTDEHHFFNGTAWISSGIKLGAIECIVGFTSGGLAVPLIRRILRLVARGSLIIGALKGMDENENFELLNKELVLWRRGKPLSTFHSLIANRHMSTRSSQSSGLSNEFSLIEKDVEGRTENKRVTLHDEGGQAPLVHIRFSALPTPKQALHANDIGVQARRQSGQDTAAEVPPSRNATFPFKSNARHQSAQIIDDDMSVVYEIAPPSPNVSPRTDKYRGSILSQRDKDDGNEEVPVAGILRQPSMRHDTAQPPSEEDAAAKSVASYAGESMKRPRLPPHITIPQRTHARAEGPMSSWGGLAIPNSGNYPVQFPVAPTRTGVAAYSPTAKTNNENWGTPRQLSFLPLFKRASNVHGVRSSKWSTFARSQSSASIKAYGGGTIICASADPGDVMSRSSEETLNDDRSGSAAPVGQRGMQITTRMNVGVPTTPAPAVAGLSFDREYVTSAHKDRSAFNREQALRKLNGQVDP